MKKASLTDVAKSLGVSKTLVSFVINNKGDEKGISAETQKRVMDKVRELNYKPNPFARGLRAGKSHTIGLVIADISNPFYSRMCRSIEDTVAQYGYNVIICSSDEKDEKESRLIQMLIDRQVDGLIISTTQEKSNDIRNLKKMNFPFVLIDRKMPRMQVDYVGVDNAQGAFDAVQHLVQLGNRRIGHLTISPNYISSIRERMQGYREALKANGIRFNKDLVREIPFDDIREGVKREIKSLLKPPYSIDGLFVVNNNIAVACMEYFQEMNIRIPQDVALVSFDDVDAFKLCYPPITAVAQPIAEMGRNSVELLLQRINESEKSFEPNQITLPTSLKIRRSCGQYLNAL